jgi:hypothetical protein
MLCNTTSMPGVKPGDRVSASIRPEDVELFPDALNGKKNLYKGTIAHKAFLGNFLYFFVDVAGTMIRAQVAYHLPQEEGQEVYLCLNPEKCMILAWFANGDRREKHNEKKRIRFSNFESGMKTGGRPIALPPILVVFFMQRWFVQGLVEREK